MSINQRRFMDLLDNLEQSAREVVNMALIYRDVTVETLDGQMGPRPRVVEVAAVRLRAIADAFTTAARLSAERRRREDAQRSSP